ncbi:MAG: hypothetical protein ACTHWM_05280 [Yaniella sp.]|uniref:hypothetical protein n=1 Tax=Yaniella sp. TaxID=2773929 RepID=UPI003F9AB935
MSRKFSTTQRARASGRVARGDNEDEAGQAQEGLAPLSEDDIKNIDDAAVYVNETCELEVLL